MWAGLTAICATILVIAMIGQSLAIANGSYINSALGVKTSEVVESDEPGALGRHRSL
ncbi:MAG: hypothetical protein IJ773_13220 [Lachnospiraceae bacterium]|nr:hypothetical protein [Lachnospiraceae bacterium]